MRILHCGIWLFLLPVAVWLRAQDERRTEAQQDGFAGPVQSVSTTTKHFHVNLQQPSGPALVLPVSCQDCAYDPDGTRTRMGQTVDGKFLGNTSELHRDPNGHLLNLESTDASTGKLLTQQQIGPFGKTNVLNYIDGKLHFIQTFTYDQNGHLSDWDSFDSEGHPTGRTHTAMTKDGVLTDSSTYGRRGELLWRQTYDPQTETERFTSFDETGAVKLEWMRAGEKVISFWKRSNEPSEFGDSFTDFKDNGDAIVYQCDNESGCKQYPVHYEYLSPNKRNPKLAEWRASDGKLLYAAYYEYELDSHDNWTRRTVWVKGPDLNDRTLYEEDARTLTYWEEHR